MCMGGPLVAVPRKVFVGEVFVGISDSQLTVHVPGRVARLGLDRSCFGCLE